VGVVNGKRKRVFQGGRVIIMPRKKLESSQPSPDLRMYTVKDVANVLRLKVDRVRILIREGRLKAYMHRGGLNLPIIYVLEKDLKQFLQDDFLSPYVKGPKKTWGKCEKIWK
jgi:excisionase family DNA binding protein